MFYRLLLDLKIFLYRTKIHMLRSWRRGNPSSVVAIITLLSAIALFIFIFQGVATVIQASIPWVKGSTVGTLYWTSIFYALKFSFVFILFCGSLILLFVLKFRSRR